MREDVMKELDGLPLTSILIRSYVLAYSEELGYTHTLSSYLGLMKYKADIISFFPHLQISAYRVGRHRYLVTDLHSSCSDSLPSFIVSFVM